jgi:SAM-dependent MidA family methyltransferase
MRRLHLISAWNASVHVELPEPSPDQRAHSERLAALIRDEIAAAGGAIDFARYMELALYAPGLGYYSAGTAKFGAYGDFVTAPELGCVFARCLARALAPTLREVRGDVLELGPGSGALAAELLLELERLDNLPQRYRLLERSADLRERQRHTLAQRCAHLLDRCVWLDAPPAQAWHGALIANEVIDALPVRLFALRDAGVFERMVSIDERNAFVWSDRRADATFAAAVAGVLNVAAMSRPYCSELCTMLAPWFVEVTRTLQHGTAWFIDYGYDRHADYYAVSRTAGTLRCHYRHRAHDNPLILPGLQDITAWVDFEAVIDAAAVCGFACEVPAAQSEFLIAHGLDEVFATAYAQAPDEVARYRLAQEVKRLTLPGEMGDAFRVLQLRRAASV